MIYFAHSKNKQGYSHQAKDHLAEVSRLATEFAGKSAWSSEAALAGLLHDLGKYGDLFQLRLQGEASGIDHWSAGAWVALTEFQAVAAALAIQGHHIGLQQGSLQYLRKLGEPHPPQLQLSDPDPERLKLRSASDGINISKPERCIFTPPVIFHQQLADMLDVRMLFSCLTDADFLDTAAHFEGIARDKGSSLDANRALLALNDFMNNSVRSSSKADRSVLDARNLLWKMVTTAADRPTGLLTLTAPTGSGKTLAMLKFALEHALRNNLKRIILVIPFLSIIEQTAEIYRSVFHDFPANYILEHHSMAGLGSEDAKDDAEAANERARRLLSENWDAPIIITTNIQLLESLFSNRPSACRKLHNLMESVIMFDEAQTLPQSLAVPTLGALSHLSTTYRSTVLFATATQPAFDTLHRAVSAKVPAGWQPAEAAPDHNKLYQALRRYEVLWPNDGETKSWQQLADEILSEEQVLCVVNLKSHAYAILDELKNNDGIFHLSTNLCPLHRRKVLDKVRDRLKKGLPCRLISTQCIEAGVDVDFPVVYRALAPLDAIAQAAGRCNREGRLLDEDGNRRMGEVRVFEPEITGDYRKRYPTRDYFQATEVTRSMLTVARQYGRPGLDLNDPKTFREYYRSLYDVSKPENQNKELQEAITNADFVRVAKEYRLIDQSAIQLLVPFEKERDLFDELQRQQDKEGINPQWIRKAQGLTVNLYRPQSNHPNLIPAKLPFGNGVSDEWFILQETEEGRYDDLLGLILPKSQQIYIA